MLIPHPYQGPVYIKNHHGVCSPLEKSWIQDWTEKYKIMAPNPKCLEELPHYIFLTEHHCGAYPVEHDRRKNQEVINKFYKEGDLILLERARGVELQAHDQPETASVMAPNAKITGWDDPKSLQVFKAAETTIDTHHGRIRAAASGEKIGEEALFASLQKIGDFIGDSKLAASFPSDSKQRSEACKALIKKISDCFDKLVEAHMESRTRSLIQSLEKYRQHKVVFVVLGASHIFLKKSDTHFPESAFMQVEMVEKYLRERGETYVIMKPRKQTFEVTA